KVIVATNERELAGLDVLYERGTANGVRGLRMIAAEELKEMEPHVRGLKALHSPNTGIIDYAQVTLAYADRFRNNGGEVVTGARVRGIRHADGLINMETDRGVVSAKHLINCAGLYSDVIARMVGVKDGVRIIPFRGEYYMLSPEASHLVRGLIYPVPNPEFPFLGVHFTKTIHGDVEAGPNAVLAFAREGYKMTNVNIGEALETLNYRGFWAMGARYWRRGLQEFYRSLSKAAFVRSLQQLVPEIEEGHLARGGAGVRAQEVERNGLMADDFHITETQNAIHVRNAPSPGATASLAIGKDIVRLAAKSFQLE
ncbi:MAG: L-2-hydroxyglutarate oxidase, partial [Dehalococcoidia bacterium]|nr:L-2-hydroxyglutarate oxidase [Dehalococcoidia bacterium]